MRAVVRSGLGKGKYFLSLEVYRGIFKGVLGEEPYPGTLNLEFEQKLELRNSFYPAGHGGFDFEYCKLRKDGKEVRAVIIRPHMSSHSRNVLEVVSEKYLRDYLGLKDGDYVKVEV